MVVDFMESCQTSGMMKEGGRGRQIWCCRSQWQKRRGSQQWRERGKQWRIEIWCLDFPTIIFLHFYFEYFFVTLIITLFTPQGDLISQIWSKNLWISVGRCSLRRRSTDGDHLQEQSLGLFKERVYNGWQIIHTHTHTHIYICIHISVCV